jgi:hypothetical protein
MKRPAIVRILLAATLGGVLLALSNWLIEGTWHLIGAGITALLLMLSRYLLSRYDEQLRKPRRLRWPGRQSRDDGSSST